MVSKLFNNTLAHSPFRVTGKLRPKVAAHLVAAHLVAAHFDKLSKFPPLKMHNSENVIGFSSTISGLVAVFKSLSFDDDLKIVNLLNQAVSRLCPNLKKAWSIQIVRSQRYRTFLLDFNEWLKEKAEGHKRLKQLILRVSLKTSEILIPSTFMLQRKCNEYKCSI